MSVSSGDAVNERSGADRVYRFTGLAWVLVGTACAVLGAACRWPLFWLWNTWTGREEYSHGPVMPLLAAFLIWQRHDRLDRTPFEGSYTGVALILLAAGLLLLGTAGAAYTVQQYAMVVAIVGLALAWTGRSVWRQLAMPALVLLLSIPQPDFILNNLSSRLQLWSSMIGVAFIRLVGISVFLEGNIIDLGNYRLQVVEACAGLRYLFPLMTIGLLIAYFFRAAFWKRVVIFLASIPVTILMNSLRIGMVGWMVDRWGIAMAEGFIHDFQGWVVFMVSALTLIGLAAGLNRIGPERRSWREVFGIDMPIPTPHGTLKTKRPIPRSAVAATLAVVVLAVTQAVIPNRPQIIPHHSPLMAFPMTLRAWHGATQRIAVDVLDTLQSDDYLLAEYHTPGGGAASLYVSYYDTQRDRRVVHSPAGCLPGSGWRIVDSAVATPAGTDLLVNRMVIVNGDDRALVYYWFDQRGRNLTNEWAVKWFLFWDSVTRRRSDGAMIRVLTPMGRGESVDRAAERLDSLVAAASAPLSQFLPR